MPSFQDFYFDSCTGENTIHARKCIPDGKPRAVVQIAHGIAEYIKRYDDFMLFLASNGILAVGNDHLGHGENIKKPMDEGFFAAENGWDCVVEDMDRLRDIVREEYHDIPYIFLGHSMGSFLTRTYLIKHPDKYDAAILSGTGHMNKPMVYGGYALASAIVKKNGVYGDGKLLNDFGFSSYNNRIPNHKTEFDWLNRDEAMVQKYIDDPLCGFIAKAGLYRDLMGGIRFVTTQKNIDMMSKEQPIYFFSGNADPVGDYGKGVERAYRAFCKAGCKDVFIRLYPGGRHEMLNEINHSEVYKDILDWINNKLQKI